MAVVSILLEIFRRPTIVEVLGELVFFIAPLWIAVFVGVLVGWAWKPKWANLVGRDMAADCSISKQEISSSSSSSSLISSLCFSSLPSLNSLKFQFPSCIPWISDDGVQQKALSLPAPVDSSDCRFVEKFKVSRGLFVWFFFFFFFFI